MSVRTSAFVLLLIASPALSAESDFVGKWDLTLKEGRMTKEGLLELIESDNSTLLFLNSNGGCDFEVDILLCAKW